MEEEWMAVFSRWDQAKQREMLDRLVSQYVTADGVVELWRRKIASKSEPTAGFVDATRRDRRVNFVSELPFVLGLRVLEYCDIGAVLSGVCTSRHWLERASSQLAEHIWEREFRTRCFTSTFNQNDRSVWVHSYRALWYVQIAARRLWMNDPVHCLEYTGHTDRVRHVRIRGDKFVSASWDGTLRLGWLKNKDPLLRSAIAFSSDVSQSEDGTDGRVPEGGDNFIARGGELEIVAKHGGSVFGAWFDGELAGTCSEDSTIKLWHVRWRKCVSELKGHSGPVYRVDFIDRDTIVSCSHDFIGVWHWSSEKLAHKLTGHTREVHRLQVLSNHIVTGSYDETIMVWTYPSCSFAWASAKCHSGGVSCLDVSSSVIASGSAKGEVFLWDLSSGELLHRWEGNDAHVGALITAVCVDEAQGIVLSSSIVSLQEAGGVLCVWSVETGACLHRFQEEAYINACKIDYGLFFSAYSDGSLRVRDLEDRCMKVVKHVKLSKGALYDVDVQGSTVVTCGLGSVFLCQPQTIITTR